MQIKGLHKNIYKLYTYARTQETLEAYRKKYEDSVNLWKKLRSEGVSLKTLQEVSGISKATYYRRKKILQDIQKGIQPPSKRPKKLNKPRWGESESQLVLKIRRGNNTYGKHKIATIIKRDFGISLSESTVGRILKHLMEKGLITKSASAPRERRKRNFTKGHANPWFFKKYEDIKAGERVQIDHMSASKNGITLKHFQGWDRVTKFIHAKCYSHAKSTSAKRFLYDLIAHCPFKITGVQVDGGSEFMAEFETACKELGLGLLVLPPRRPTYNGGVERGNRTFREEFYANPKLKADSVGAINAELQKALHKYNTYRPHFNLKGLTPMQYIQINILKAAA